MKAAAIQYVSGFGADVSTTYGKRPMKYDRQMIVRVFLAALGVMLAAGACGGSDSTEQSATPNIEASSEEATSDEQPSVAETSDSTSPSDGASVDCDAFFTQPFETRKDDLATQTNLRPSLDQQCPEQLERLDQAIDLQTRARAINPKTALMQGGLNCNTRQDPIRAWSLVTNQTDEVLGIIYSIRLVSGTESSTATPLVIRGLQPGEDIRLSADLESVTPSDPPQFDCHMKWSVFVDDTTDVDVSPLADPVEDSEPSEWFPALVAAQRSYEETGDRTLAEQFEDIRSPSTLDGDGESATAVLPCEETIAMEDGIMTFAYARVSEVDGPEIRMGAFRQGFDGRWRWLTSAIGASSVPHADCLAAVQELAS